MTAKSLSDLIEEYLKHLIEEQGKIEIQRNQVATHFDCVPSQINYVINTRFTVYHGYQVESKRGGGGYIRIHEIEMRDDVDQIEKMLELTKHPLTQIAAQSMIQTLYEHEVITLLEGKLMRAAMDDAYLTPQESVNNVIRARVLRAMLSELLIKQKSEE